MIRREAEKWFDRFYTERGVAAGGPWMKILERVIGLFPGTAGPFYFRTGHIRKALKVLGRAERYSGSRRIFVERLTHMAAVLEEGRAAPPGRRNLPGPYNGKVIFAVHNSLPCDSAGYAIRSHQTLRALKGADVDIRAVTRPGYPWDLDFHAHLPHVDRDVVEGISYERIPSNGTGIFGDESFYIDGYARMLADLARRHEAAVVHGASNYMNGLAAAGAARAIGGRSIYEMRGLWHLSRAVREPGYEKTDHFRYCRIMELAAAEEADGVIAISSALKVHLVEEGIPADKITVISNAVDTEEFRPMTKDRELEERFGLRGRIVFGFIGSLTGYEGLDTLIRAFSGLRNDRLPASLLIIGEGYAGKRLKNLAESSPARRHIRLTGFIPFGEVRRYHSLVDIFPFPRTGALVCHLVPPLKPLEAMAMARPVVVSDLPPLTDMVHQGKTGLVCRPEDPESLADCLGKLAASEDLRRRLGENARAWVEKERSWNGAARKYLALYRGHPQNLNFLVKKA